MGTPWVVTKDGYKVTLHPILKTSVHLPAIQANRIRHKLCELLVHSSLLQA
jgi:ribosomal protein S3AE